jgi:UDP-glucose 4-epimerase
MKTVVVLGGAGFLGSLVVHRLVKAGHQVIVLDSLSPDCGGSENNLSSSKDKIRFINSKIESYGELPSLLQTADVIIDAIALTAHKAGMANPELDLNYNLHPHVHLIKSLKTLTGKHIVLLGSRSQYGLVKADSADENTAQNPVDSQGICKVAAESYFKIFCRPQKFFVTSLRITNAYGRNQRISGELGLVGSFITDALAAKSIDIFGNADRKKNLVCGEDVAKIVEHFVNILPTSPFEAYNVSGSHMPLRQLIESIVTECGSGSWTTKPFPPEIKNIDTGDFYLDDSKLRSMIPNLKYTDPPSAIKDCVGYFKTALKMDRL